MAKLLSVVEAAERLHLSPRSVQRLITLGRLRAQKMPGRTGAYIITSDDLAEYKRAAS